jgi:hypothetical protein
MSETSHGTAHPRAEDDRVDSRAVALVGAGALLIFLVAALAAMAFLSWRDKRHEFRPLPVELGRSKIGLVEQDPFFEGVPLRGDRDRAARQQRLAGWGWVDQARGLAHIPIEEAMNLVAAGARPPRGGEPLAPPYGAARGGVDAPSVPIAAPRPTEPPPATTILPRKEPRR